VLGEQIVGRIARRARDVACVRPGSKLFFADPSGTIDADWGKSFFAYLHVSPKTGTAQEIRGGLARELIRWAKHHSEDAKEIGLTPDSNDRLHLLCQPLQPVLDPLPD
jgi:hypothetical protein